MSKRVYEIAKELNLETKEVIGRLNEAGVDVKHHSATVDEPIFERVFGNGQPQNGRTEAQEEEAQEARAEAERSGHESAIAEAPAEEPVSVSVPETEAEKPGPAERAPASSGRGERGTRA
jgi:translation initiation factor IF-2